MRGGLSLRRAFQSLLTTLEDGRGTGVPWSTLTCARIRPDGAATILNYEAPPPILISTVHAAVLPARSLPEVGATAEETLCHLQSGEGVMLLSDGITQAGVGQGSQDGWGVEGVAKQMTDWLRSGKKPQELPALTLAHAHRLWRGGKGDDCTAALIQCREGLVVTILTGPPSDPKHDRETVRRFMEADGLKIVCGATTARVVARETGKDLKVGEVPDNPLIPPTNIIDGIDLTTEGAVTLNQVCNLLDVDISNWTEKHGVATLANFLQAADLVRIFHGQAVNQASREMLEFRQHGVLERRQVVTLLADKLRAQGKLVEIIHC